MGTRFDGAARKAIDFAMIEVERRGDRALDPSHLLLGLLQASSGPIPEALRRIGVEIDALRTTAAAAIAPAQPADDGRIDVAWTTEAILQRSAEVSLARGATVVSDLDILIAAAEQMETPAGRALGAHALTAEILAAAAAQAAAGPAAGPGPGVGPVSEGRVARLTRTGIGYDSHRFGVGGPLVLGGVSIEADVHLAGHSDGDAIAHALTDAVLGAAGAGDIGEMFADTDPANKGRNSVGMLRDAVERVRQLGWRVEHVDVVVVAETPRVGPHRAAMRAALAPALGVLPEAVAIKGKTNEGMGWIGRGEGIAAIAVVLIDRIEG
jgi:2-C-methyl-D-erythritol 2,4-cyclodiphosphate synthase